MGFASKNVLTLGEALSDIRSRAGNIKSRASGHITNMLAGNFPGLDLIVFAEFLVTSRAQFERALAIPGMAAYAVEEMAQPGRNVAQEYTDMIAAIDAVINWTASQYPRSGGFLEVYRDDGTKVTYSPAQTAQIRTLLQTLVDAID